jgi:hypothetical protein
VAEIAQTGWLSADFFTHSYRISGRVDVHRKNLADLLNDQTTSFVELEDAYISSIDRPGDIIATYPASGLAKVNLTIVLAPRQDDVLSRKLAYGSYSGAYINKVFLTVPSFEITGYLRLPTRVDLRRMLSAEVEEFIAVVDGQARASIRPDVYFNSGGILVNKRQIGAFCLEKET